MIEKVFTAPARPQLGQEIRDAVQTVPNTESTSRRYPNVLQWIVRAVPNFLVLALLAAVAYWGHHNDWKLPSFAHLTGAPAETPADWCAEHDVPESICVECNPTLFPKLPDYGFCEVHGVHNCTIDHPELAQLQPTDPVIIPDPDVVARASALKPRVENNAACPLYRRRVQLPSVDSMTSAGIDIAPVEMRPIVEFITANGEINYDRNRLTHVTSPVPGKLWRILKREGEAIDENDILLLVDSTEVGQAKAEFLQALTAKDQSQQLLDNVQDLINREVYRAGASQEVEARASLKSAEVALVKAEQALLNLGLKAPTSDLISLSVAEVSDRIRYLGIPTELTEKLDKETPTANLLPVRANHGGVVIAREMVEGEVVDRDDGVLEFADVSRLWATLNVRQDDAKYVLLGQSVQFFPDGMKSPVIGQVVWISTAADEKSRTIQVRVELDNSNDRLRAGMFGVGKIILRDEPSVVTVKNESVHWDGSCNVVFVRDKDFFKNEYSKIFHTRTVKVGAKDDEFTELIAGVVPGEVVATQGSGVLMAAVLKGNLGAG